jgi:hypothetical protein
MLKAIILSEKRLTFLIQILKSFTVAGTEKKNKKVAGP